MTDREQELLAEVALWRTRALEGWQREAEQDTSLRELLEMRRSLSWRVTGPLRAVRGRLP